MLPEAARPAPRDPQRARHRPGLRRGRRGLPRRTCWRSSSATCTPAGPNEHDIEARIVRDVNPERFRRDHRIDAGGAGQEGAEPLGDRRQVGRGQRAAARPRGDRGLLRRRPAPSPGVHPKADGKDGHVYRIGKVPRTLIPIGERLEPRFGRLGREYRKIVFDKALLPTDPTLEWVTPGHPLFEVVRDGRPRPRRTTTCGGGRSSSTSSANEPARARRLRRLDQGRPGQHACTAASSSSRRDAAGRDDRPRSRPSSSTIWSRPRRARPVPDDDRLPDRQAGRAVPLRAGVAAVPGGGRRGARATRVEHGRTARRDLASTTLIDRQQRPARRLPEPPGRGPERPRPRRADLPGRGSTSTS